MGDVAETIALLLPPPVRTSDSPLSYWIEHRLLPLRSQSEENQHAAMLEGWRELNQQERFVWNKLISGGFRVGVSQQLVMRALSEVGGIEPAVVAHRLMGDWEPSPAFFTDCWLMIRATPISAAPILSFWLSRLICLLSRWVTDGIGRPNGNGMAFAASSSDAMGKLSSGRGEKSWSPSVTPRSRRSAIPCPQVRSSTARSYPGKTIARCRSPSSRGGSAASP